MNRVALLDCTLRDGGYINDWNFGKDKIYGISNRIIETGVDIFEIGFLKDEEYNDNRSVFNETEQITKIISPKKKNIQYAAMIEVVNPIPLEKLADKTEQSVDIIRVIIWKRLLKEGFEYCKGIVEKGYRLCIQPARVDQYSMEEFREMLRLFEQLNPMAIYVVDSFGTQDKDSIMKYFFAADSQLPGNIMLGYHGHNNKLQALDIAKSFVELELQRDIIVDGSIYGIGRGAGNLNLEIFADYLNQTHNKKYSVIKMLEIYEKYIENIYMEQPWGYCKELYITSLLGCNPNYGVLAKKHKEMSVDDFYKTLELLPEERKIRYDEKYFWNILKEVVNKKGE